MPNKDHTGPEGKGPKTGRQMGNCENAIRQDQRRGCNRPKRRCRRGD